MLMMPLRGRRRKNGLMNRDNAIARMFGTENDSKVSEEEEGYEGFIKYLIEMYNAEDN